MKRKKALQLKKQSKIHSRLLNKLNDPFIIKRGVEDSTSIHHDTPVEVKKLHKARKRTLLKESNRTKTKANQLIPNQTKANSTKAKQTKANQTKANQTKANQTKAKQTKANKTKANQTKAKQTKAKHTKANQTKANQTKAKQTKAKQSQHISSELIADSYNLAITNFRKLIIEYTHDQFICVKANATTLLSYFDAVVIRLGEDSVGKALLSMASEQVSYVQAVVYSSTQPIFKARLAQLIDTIVSLSGGDISDVYRIQEIYEDNLETDYNDYE